MFSQWISTVFSHPDLPVALAIVIKTVVIYAFLVLGLRWLGRRELGQMSIYDLVLIVVIANAVQNAMVGNDTSLFGGIISAVTLLLCNRLVTWLSVQFPQFRRWMVGEPVLIVRDGVLLTQPMRHEGLTRPLVMAAMREHGIGDLQNVQMAVLEVDGTISIVPKEAQVHRTRRRFRGIKVQ